MCKKHFNLTSTLPVDWKNIFYLSTRYGCCMETAIQQKDLEMAIILYPSCEPSLYYTKAVECKDLRILHLLLSCETNINNVLSAIGTARRLFLHEQVHAFTHFLRGYGRVENIVQAIYSNNHDTFKQLKGWRNPHERVLIAAFSCDNTYFTKSVLFGAPMLDDRSINKVVTVILKYNRLENMKELLLCNRFPIPISAFKQVVYTKNYEMIHLMLKSRRVEFSNDDMSMIMYNVKGEMMKILLKEGPFASYVDSLPRNDAMYYRMKVYL